MKPRIVKSRAPLGGQANIRGVLIQTLIALLEVLLDESQCNWLSLEPNLKSEKFDLLWENGEGLHALQVKSSINCFNPKLVDELTRVMQSEASMELRNAKCSLILVGEYDSSLRRLDELNGVKIEFRGLGSRPEQILEAFIAQAASRLHEFLDRENFEPLRAWTHKVIVNDLAFELLNAATKGKRVNRQLIVRRLKRWVAESPYYKTATKGGRGRKRQPDRLATFRRYLRRVAEDSAQVVLRGITTIGEDIPSMRLANVYVSLDTKSYRISSSLVQSACSETEIADAAIGWERDEIENSVDHEYFGTLEQAFFAKKAKFETDARRENEKLSALEVLFRSETNRVVLVGEPGCGKSTFLQYVTLCLADQLSGASTKESHFQKVEIPELLRSQRRLPLRILLREFAPKLADNDEGRSVDVEAFLKEQLSKLSFDNEAKLLPRILESGDVFVMFDGLDEVPTPLVQRVKEAIETFASGNYQSCRIVVTCRVKSYETDEFRLASFPRPFEIAPLSKENQQPKFVRAWFAELEEAQETFRGEGDMCASSLLAAIASPRLQEMAGNPFFLTAMAGLHRPDKALPETAAELMDALVNSVLEESRKVRGGRRTAETELGILLKDIHDGFKVLRNGLEAAAYWARIERKDTRSRYVKLRMLKEHLVLSEDQPSDWAEKRLLPALQNRAGLLQSEDGENFEFAYRFEEFLAGCFLANEDRWSKGSDNSLFHLRALALLRQQPDYARYVVLWACGFNTHVRTRDRQKVRELVEVLLGEGNSTAPPPLSDMKLAVDIACDVKMEKWVEIHVPGTKATVRRLREYLERLRNAMGHSKITTCSYAASALGRLGDDRRGVRTRVERSSPRKVNVLYRRSHVLLPDIQWIQIPAGKFKMGGWSASEGRKEFDCHQIVKPYRISRYPITVEQFEAFLNDKGYDDASYWKYSEESFQWWMRNKDTGPQNYDIIFQTPNHPRVGVCWYEAVAYCEWLRLNCNEDIKLPSESQWERAARGKSGRKWPWPSKIAQRSLASFCNCEQTGIAHTSAVGLFQKGDTPPEAGNTSGIADLIGNVWEWCRTPWIGEYEDYEKEHERDFREDNPKHKGSRVLRGGSWDDGNPAYLSPSFRFSLDPGHRAAEIGFRIVCHQ